MHRRSYITLAYTLMVLVMETHAEQRFQIDEEINLNDLLKMKEEERDLNNLQHNQLFLISNDKLSKLKLPQDKTKEYPKFKATATSSHEEDITEKYREELKHNELLKMDDPYIQSTTSIPKRRVSRFRLMKNNNLRKGHHSINVHRVGGKGYPSNKMELKKERGHIYQLPQEAPFVRRIRRRKSRRWQKLASLFKWSTKDFLPQTGQLRLTRSSCTGGKVWRKGQCRCPYRSNWDEEESKCVCIYGTYQDKKGNCRSFV